MKNLQLRAEKAALAKVAADISAIKRSHDN
jgi:hypothetical protein